MKIIKFIMQAHNLRYAKTRQENLFRKTHSTKYCIITMNNHAQGGMVMHNCAFFLLFNYFFAKMKPPRRLIISATIDGVWLMHNHARLIVNNCAFLVVSWFPPYLKKNTLYCSWNFVENLLTDMFIFLIPIKIRAL